MEIRQLKYFLKVAETLNFSEASRKLYITQSTLSQQISHLEQEIGLPLFERNSHEVYLTEAGKELLPYAQNAVNCTMACVDHMNDLKEMLTGELNIGVTYSFSNIMAETLIAFLHAYPHVKLNIQYRSMQELMDGLKKRELDLVLAFKPIKTDKAIDSRAIFSNRLAAIVNENHPLARLSSIKLSELERYDLILPCKGLQARNAFDYLIEGKDLDFKIMVEVNNVNIIFDLLHRSNLVTVLSESTTILLFGLITMFIYSFIAGEKIQMLQTPMHWLYAVQLALLPTVLSLFFMTISINLIGSTPAAIMGALEPVTAVIIGVCIFGESFSFQLAIGILAILAGVTIIIARKK
jgi:LysR family transcriptional regulator, cyn operon transcriptional activator